MATVFDVADYFIAASHKRGNSELTILRLHKLIYFAHLWSYLAFDRPLFDAEMQAWEYGPVFPAVQTKYSPHSDCPIDTEPVDLDYSKFTNEEITLLFDVDQYYKTQSTWLLVEKSHCKGSPWEKAYKSGVLHTVIPEKYIRDVCKSKKNVNIPRISKKLPGIMKVSVPKRNANGVALLPREVFED
jgi:uncharacterized phage-associated protein